MTGALIQDIKFNCDVSDAQFWGYFSICGLLLRYRDLYCSEHRLKPWNSIDRNEIAAWIAAKEKRWPELENEPFRELNIAGRKYDPFDAAGINRALEQEGLVYGAGYGMYLKPTFFLADRKSQRAINGLTVHTSGTELVRDLLTAPGMLQNNVIFLRLEPLRSLIHFKFAELNSRRHPALEAGFARYGLHSPQLIEETFEKKLEDLAERFADLILLHEIAEHEEDVPAWRDMLSAAGDRKNEHYLRAVKDLVADTADSGPLKKVIDAEDAAGLGLILGLKEGFQKLLIPDLSDAYTRFAETGEWNVLDAARRQVYARTKAERDRILELFRDAGPDAFAEQLRKIMPV